MAGDQDTAPAADTLSQRAFARLLGVSEMAVRKGIKAGRLGDCVVRDGSGRPCIVRPDIAAARWRASSRTGAGATGANGAPVREPIAARSQDTGRASSPAPVSSLVEAQQRATEERARKLRLDNDAREGRLVPIDRVKREAFEAARQIRDAMLNLPARLAGELAADTDAAVVFRKLDAAIREALTRTADDMSATVH